MNIIPKVFHYCWFGGNPLPQRFLECKDQINKLCPDYEIKEWNEENFDITSVPFVKAAYEAKKYAFVADYVRMYALYNEGGIYIETDAVVIKPIDELLNYQAFIGRGSETVTLPMFGMVKGHNLAKAVMEYYQGHNYDFLSKLTINKITYSILVNEFGYENAEKVVTIKDGIVVYPREYFFTDWSSGVMQVSDKSFVVHYGDASWQSEEARYEKKVYRKLAKAFSSSIAKKIARVCRYLKYKGLRSSFDKARSLAVNRIGPIAFRLPIFPLRNQIVFDNFNGHGYGCNPKYIAEEIISRKLPYRLVWVVDANTYSFPEQIDTVRINSLKYFRTLATSKVWVDNVRKETNIRKKPGQLYIQVWHGFVPFKKMEKNAEGTRSKHAIEKSKHDSEMIDFFTSGCRMRTELYSSGAFYYSGEVYECGTPRNDLLISDNRPYEKVYSHFEIDRSKKIFMYAPTFRNSKDLSPYLTELDVVTEWLRQRFGENYICLVRLHPSMRNMGEEFTKGKDCINASGYDDIQELLAVADVVVSDYSDVLFEASLAKAKVFVYATDIADYMDERSFYLKLEDLPYSIATNLNELKANIIGFDESKYMQNVEAFFTAVGVNELGNASAKVVDRIVEFMKGK